MIDYRVHDPDPLHTVRLKDLAAQRDRSYPVVEEPGLCIEFDASLPQGLCFLNFPSRTFSIREGTSLDELVEILAWEASAWEAIEVYRYWRKRGLIGLIQ